jgi:hypothetical protein
MKDRLMLWATVAFLIATCLSAICLTASLMTWNEKGMVEYGVATMISGVMFRACLDTLFD